MSVMTKKIYYHDTDCGGVVYYANYLKYLEEARTEHLCERKIDLKAYGDSGIFFVVKNVTIEYKMPARYADTLSITSRITKTRNVSLEFSQEILRAQQLLITAQTTLVCVDKSFKPRAIPEELQKIFAA